MKRSTLLTLAVLAVLLGAPALQAMNEWTVIVYVSNDDHDPAIAEANARNFKNMARIGSGKGYEVLIQVDGGPPKKTAHGSAPDAPFSGTERFLVQRGELVGEGRLGEKNMGSPYTLWECLKWAAEKHPARRYCLVINSHGSGVFSWRGLGSTSSSRPGAVNFDPGRFVAYDDTDDDCLTVYEVEAVLKAFRKQLNQGRPLDILAFDACMPGSIEALFQFREVFSFLVGSPESVNMDAFNYHATLNALADNPRLSPETFAQAIAAGARTRLIGAWKTAGAQEIATALDRVSIALLEALESSPRKLTLPDLVTYGGDDRYWDLEKFARVLKNGQGNVAQAPNAQVLRELGAELLEALLRARTSTRGKLSVAWPKAAEYQEFLLCYKALALSQATHWDEVLDTNRLAR